MPLRTLADLNAAYEAGRFHVQRVLKNAGTAHATQWADPTFASGQPAYDAHVGAPLVVTPTGRAAGSLSQTIGEVGATVTVTRAA